MKAPPSRTAWRIDGEMRGHSVVETPSYLAARAAYADELELRRDAWPVTGGWGRLIPWRWRRKT